jgi:hypothetical protein
MLKSPGLMLAIQLLPSMLLIVFGALPAALASERMATSSSVLAAALLERLRGTPPQLAGITDPKLRADLGLPQRDRQN